MNGRIELFLFIDALGWHTVQEYGYLESLLPERKSIEMQFGYSCTAIPTILTGKRPSEHGHLGLFRYSPEESPFKGISWLEKVMIPKSLWNRGRVRHKLSQLVKWFYGYTGYFQLYAMPFGKLGQMDYAEKDNMFIAHGMGDIENLCDVLEKSGLKYHISDWHLSDGENFERGCEAISDGCEFLFLYSGSFDALMHDEVGHREAIEPRLKWFETQIVRLFEECRKAGKEVHFTIFSDHGMTPLTKTVDVMSVIEKTGLVFGRDYGAVYDSTMFRVTYLQPSARRVIETAMEAYLSDGHWVTEDEEIAYGIYRKDRYFGDALFLMNPGIQIVPSDMGNKPLNGMHGFMPSDRYSQAALLSNEPIPEKVERVSDYFGMMMEGVKRQAGHSL